MCATVICFPAPSANDRIAEKPVAKINHFNLFLMGFSYVFSSHGASKGDTLSSTCHSHTHYTVIDYWIHYKDLPQYFMLEIKNKYIIKCVFFRYETSSQGSKFKIM